MKIGKKEITFKYTLRSLRHIDDNVGSMQDLQEKMNTYMKNPFDKEALEAMLNFVVAGTLSTNPIDIDFLADNLEAHEFGEVIAQAILIFRGKMKAEEKPVKKPRGRPKKNG